MSLTTTRAHILLRRFMNFVLSLQCYILGWRHWQWQMLCRSWRNGIGGYIYREVGHPDRSKRGKVYLAPVNVSSCVEPHGKTQARVPRSTEILIPHSFGLFTTGMHQIYLVDQWAFSPSLHRGDFKVYTPITTAVMSYLRKQVSFLNLFPLKNKEVLDFSSIQYATDLTNFLFLLSLASYFRSNFSRNALIKSPFGLKRYKTPIS